MASANHDQNHIDLSKIIYDSVAAAGTDGVEATMAQRNLYLNRANRMIQHLVISAGKDKVEKHLQGLVTTQAVTFSSSGYALPTDYVTWLALKKDSPAAMLRYVFPSRKDQLDAAVNPNEAGEFTIVGGKTYAYQSGAILSSGAGTLTYLKNDVRASNGDTNDIAIDAKWYPTLLSFAAYFHWTDKGDVNRAQMQLNNAMKMVELILMEA